MDVFRIGLIGAGSIGTRHIKAIDELALIELVAIADPAPSANSFSPFRLCSTKSNRAPIASSGSLTY